MTGLPSGVVTFLFSDVEGSTRLFQRYPATMPGALARHDAIIRAGVTAHHGQVFLNVGDGFCMAFADAGEAVSAALDIQIALNSADWGDMEPLRVRMGLHTGSAEARGQEYLASLTLARVQRIMAAGHGSQTLLSAVTAQKTAGRLPEGTSLRSLGEYRLRGLAQPEVIYQLVDPELPTVFPPLRALTGSNGSAESGAPLSQLVRDRLIGRRGELQQLHQHWQEALRGGVRLVTLSGEPGVGKTRLAAEFIQDVQRAGATVLRGGSYEYEATTPYLPFVEALRDWVRRAPLAELRRQPLATAAELAKLAPEIESKLGSLPANPPLAANEERLRFFDHVGRFMHDLAAPAGLLLFLDDLHWADQASLSLLRYLLRYLRDDRVMVLAAYREVELNRSHPLAAALVDWTRERLAARMPLSRLSRDDTGLLLAALLGQGKVSDAFVDLVYQETEGNPFFVEEVVKALVEQEEIYRAGDRWERRQVHELTVPQSIKEAIGRRLNRLSQDGADTLSTAAALGKQFSFTELAVVRASSEDVLLDSLDEAVAAQLIAPLADESFAFTHDKIREVLVEEMNPIRRRRLHRRIAEALEGLHAAKSPDCPADLAYHFSLGGDLEKALSYYRQATECARAVFAHDEALGYLARAREAAEELALADQIVAIDKAMGQVYREHGMYLPAVDAYQRALDKTEAVTERAHLKLLIGESYMHIGDRRGEPLLEEAVEALDPQAQAADLALALASLGRYAHYNASHAQAIVYLERARQLAESADDANVLANIYAFLCGAYQHMARFDESNRWAQAAIELGRRRGLPLAEALGYEFLAENAMNQGLWRDCLRYSQLNHDIGQRIGALDRVAWSGFPLCQAWYVTGNLQKARAIALSTLDLSERIGEARLSTWLVAALAHYHRDLGEVEAADNFARQAVARAEALGQLALIVFSLSAVAGLHMQRGHWHEAVALYEKIYALTLPTDNRIGILPVGVAYATALLRLGRVADAAAVIEPFESLVEGANAPHALALVHRVQGLILAAEGKPRQALAVLDQAVSELEQLDCQFDLAWTLVERSLAHRAQQDASQAEQDAQRARDIFKASGAHGALQRAAIILAGGQAPETQ
jgi:class 3 adenylate cyclase/tetratricopeptide (TPR) repeat protein